MISFYILQKKRSFYVSTKGDKGTFDDFIIVFDYL
jgi:hypothetical protein